MKNNEIARWLVAAKEFKGFNIFWVEFYDHILGKLVREHYTAKDTEALSHLKEIESKGFKGCVKHAFVQL